MLTLRHRVRRSLLMYLTCIVLGVTQSGCATILSIPAMCLTFRPSSAHLGLTGDEVVRKLKWRGYKLQTVSNGRFQGQCLVPQPEKRTDEDVTVVNANFISAERSFLIGLVDCRHRLFFVLDDNGEVKQIFAQDRMTGP